MKTGKTKSHVKLYFTEHELEVLDWLVGEGLISLVAAGEIAIEGVPIHVANRICNGISDARRYI